MDQPAEAAPHGQQLAKFRSRTRTVRTVLFVVLGAVLAGLIWFGVSAVAAVTKITDASDTRSPVLRFIGQQLDPNALSGEGDGRINLLFIGIGGAGHKGGTLADTIMVASIDSENHKLALLSLPRDLRVPIAGGGLGKINAAHSYGESEEPGRGPRVLKETVSDILDLPIHYYIRADFTGFTKLIDVVGGVDIDVPKALYDPLYPDSQLEGYEPFSIKAGPQHLSGKTALKYARSRQTTSDFDRASRQQQILVAFRKQVLSLGVLANPAKLGEILKILGDHLRTDLSLAEMQRLFGLSKDIEGGAIVTKVLDNSADGPLDTSSEGGYYLVPKTGNFREIQRIAHELFTDPYLAREQAKIEILNGTETAGMARELELDLRSLGYTIASINRTDPSLRTILYDYTGGTVPFTVRFLADRLGASVRVAERPANAERIDLRLVLGTDYQPVPLLGDESTGEGAE